MIRACEAQLKSAPPTGHFFGLYGADIILADHLIPWLTEIQKGPGLSHDDAVKRRVLPPMLLSALDLVLDIQERRRAGRTLDDLVIPEDYRWVIGPCSAAVSAAAALAQRSRIRPNGPRKAGHESTASRLCRALQRIQGQFAGGAQVDTRTRNQA